MNEKIIAVCPVCPRQCHLEEGQTGVCKVRIANEGKVVSKYPSSVSAIQIDPMEKKPLYHFLPGESIFSIGTFGCTMNCGFCQNYHLLKPPMQDFKEVDLPERLVESCLREGIRAMAFTYNEPFVNYELVMKVFKIAKEKGLATVLVTNGNVMPDILKKVIPFVDAMNIDLKAFYPEFYKKQGGDLETVKNTIQYAVSKGVHVEVCLLVIPGENDDLDIFKEMLQWMKGISEDMILHINRYHPSRKYTIPSTPEETLKEMKKTALQYLKYVYIGNLPFVSHDTVCSCGEVLVKRDDGNVKVLAKDGICPKCHKKIPLIL